MTTFLATFKNHLDRGFSLVEVIVGSAVIAGVALTAATLYKNRNQAQADIEVMRDLDRHHKRLTDIYQLSYNCNALLRERNTPVPTTLGFNITHLYVCNSNCVEGAEPNTITQRIMHSNYAYAPTSPEVWLDGKRQWRIRDISWNPPNISGIHMMNIQYEYNPGKPGSKRVTRGIPLNINYSGGFRNCISESDAAVKNLAQEFCFSLSMAPAFATWDPALQRCTPTTNLHTGDNLCTGAANNIQIPMGLSPAGFSTGTFGGVNEPGCKRIQSGMRLHEMIDSNQTVNCPGALVPRITVTGGRFTIACP